MFFNDLAHQKTYSHVILITFLIYWKQHNCEIVLYSCIDKVFCNEKAATVVKQIQVETFTVC